MLVTKRQLLKKNIGNICEVLTALKMPMVALLIVVLCEPVGRHQHFGGIYCSHVHSFTVQKTSMDKNLDLNCSRILPLVLFKVECTV
jgi:hypothetical protein